MTHVWSRFPAITARRTPTSRWNTGACIDSREIDSHGRIRQRRVFGGPTREAHQSPWLFDEITATYAHFGAGDGQQLTGRLATLFQPNLAQVLAKKRITQGWTVAGDYMTGAGTHSFRLALAGENRTGLDSLRVEMYREMAKPRGFGRRRARETIFDCAGCPAGWIRRYRYPTGAVERNGVLRRTPGVRASGDRSIGALSAQVLWTQAFGNSRPVAAARRIEAGLR